MTERHSPPSSTSANSASRDAGPDSAFLGGPSPPVPSTAVDQDPVHHHPPMALAVSGLIVEKAALVTALRVYVPQLTDIRQLDDGRFELAVAEPTPPAGGSL